MYDKGKGAVVIFDVESRDVSGSLLATSRSSVFIRGIGGFGGEKYVMVVDTMSFISVTVGLRVRQRCS